MDAEPEQLILCRHCKQEIVPVAYGNWDVQWRHMRSQREACD